MSEFNKQSPDNKLTMFVLNAAPELEEDLIDYLLTFEQIKGFTSFLVHGHGEHNDLSVAEQVTGRRKRVQYEIFLDSTVIPLILANIAEAVGKDITYWELAISNFGRVEL